VAELRTQSPSTLNALFGGTTSRRLGGSDLPLKRWRLRFLVWGESTPSLVILSRWHNKGHNGTVAATKIGVPAFPAIPALSAFPIGAPTSLEIISL